MAKRFISEAYSLQEIADLWCQGDLEACSSPIHGYWRIREIEPYVTHRTIRSKVDQDRMEIDGFGDEPIVIEIKRNGLEVLRDAERLKMAETLFGRGFLVPVRFVFRTS